MNLRRHFSALSFGVDFKSHGKTMDVEARLCREKKGFLMELPRLGVKAERSQSGEKLSDALVSHRSGQNADMTKGKFLPHRKKEKDYLETWGKD